MGTAKGKEDKKKKLSKLYNGEKRNRREREKNDEKKI